MATFDITIYRTEELDGADGEVPLYRARDYLKGTFGNSSNHSVNVDINTSTIWAPQQEVHSGFSSKFPCDGTYYSVDYENLGQWWKDYVDCKLNQTRDADMLLTDSGPAGITINKQFIAVGAEAISDCVSYFKDYECGYEYDSMRAVLHEFGHSLLDVDESVDPSSLSVSNPEHNVGNTVTRSNTTYRTPMGYGAEGNHENQCDNSVGSAHTTDCAEYTYSQCADGRFDHY